MGNNKENNASSRRQFLSLFGLVDKAATEKKEGKPEMVKMLTAEGKLVEVDKAIFDKIATKQKATNKEIYDWMQNPSKENNPESF
jgi:hypothetical protein